MIEQRFDTWLVCNKATDYSGESHTLDLAPVGRQITSLRHLAHLGMVESRSYVLIIRGVGHDRICNFPSTFMRVCV